MSPKKNISVIGAGSWGSALALLLAKNGHDVNLWDFDSSHISTLEKDRENKRHLQGCRFPDNLKTFVDINETIKGCSIILMVVPSHGFRAVFQSIADKLARGSVVISATKGVENESLKTMSQIMTEILGSCSSGSVSTDLAVLSGPSFAREVADEVPTAVTIGCKNLEAAEMLQSVFNTNYFRVYTSNDLVGLEISAALKNIVAIAAGICDGLQFGANARAALITRGLVEITRLGRSLGAQEATFYGLSGMGDLVLTCTGDLSRNRTVGLKLGEGKKIDQILEEMEMVAEGVKTTKSVSELAEKMGVEMPILEQVYKILYENKDCLEAVRDLLSRDPKPE